MTNEIGKYVYYAGVIKYTDPNYKKEDGEKVIKKMLEVEPAFEYAISEYKNDDIINIYISFNKELLIENTLKDLVYNIVHNVDEIEYIDYLEEISLNGDVINSLLQTQYFTFGRHPVVEYLAQNPKEKIMFDSFVNNKNEYLFTSKEELIKISGEYSQDLAEEVERIYQCSNNGQYIGNPFNYILEDISNTNTIVDILITSLRKNDRILSKSAYLLTRNSKEINELLGLMDQNLVIPVNAISFDEDNESNSMMLSLSNKMDINELIAKMRDEKTVTFIISPNPTLTNKILLEAETYGYHNFVIIRDNELNYSDACEFVKQKGLDMGIPSDKLNDLIDYTFPIDAHKKDKYKRHRLSLFVKDYYRDRYKFNKLFSVYDKILLNNKTINISESIRENCIDYMIGLKDIKEYTDKIIKTYKFFKLMELKYGYTYRLRSRHMVFAGSPGTAKTTTARTIYNKLCNEQVLTGSFVECGRADLVGKYVGWTAIQVKEKFREATGGMLFIDEAYSLIEGGENDFGREAITTIIQEMERNMNTIVVFAGYPDEMKNFINSNPGLKSRINFYINFPDYTLDELIDILKFMAENNSVQFTQAAINQSREYFKDHIQKPNFGNGRFVRNYLDKVMMNHASRLFDNNDTDPSMKKLVTITANDCKNIVIEDEIKTKQQRKAGFNV